MKGKIFALLMSCCCSAAYAQQLPSQQFNKVTTNKLVLPNSNGSGLDTNELAISRADKRLIFKNVDGSIGYGSLLNAAASGRKAVEQGDASDLTIGSGRTIAASAGDVCNVADLGLTGAFSPACANKEITIPPGTWSFSTTLTIPAGASVRWLGRNAVLAYTGTGDALFINGSKNIDLHGMTVDLTGAGASAKALHVAGAWFLNVYGPRVVTGGSSQEAIAIETSPSGTTAYGAYLINIYNPDCHGAGKYCIHAFQTTGDTSYQVTHLNLYGGWSKGQTYGFWADNLSTANISGFVVDTGTDGIFLQNSNNVTLSPGELGPNTGYGINYGPGNSAIREVFRSQAASGGAAGYRNTTIYTPQILDQGQMRLYGSNTDQGYWAEVKSIYSYAKSFALTVRGGDSGSPELMSYGSTQGLWLGQGYTPTRLGTASATPTNTFGLPYVSTIAGTPTAAPTAYTGQAPIAIDSTNGKICAYIASAWKCATLQ